MRSMRTLAVAVVLPLALACQSGGPRRPRPAVDDARIELPTIAGRTWILATWPDGTAAPSTPPVSLQYAAGAVRGRSGCNQYTAPIEQRPGRTIAVGPIAATRMMCPPPVQAVEARFLDALGAATALELRDDRLGIVTTLDGRAGTMRFTAQTTPPR